MNNFNKGFGKNQSPRMDDDLDDLDLEAISDDAVNDLDLSAQMAEAERNAATDDATDFNLDDLDDPRPRPKVRKSKSGLFSLLILLVLGAGGAFTYITYGDQLMAMVGQAPSRSKSVATVTPPAAPTLTPVPTEVANAKPPTDIPAADAVPSMTPMPDIPSPSSASASEPNVSQDTPLPSDEVANVQPNTVDTASASSPAPIPTPDMSLAPKPEVSTPPAPQVSVPASEPLTNQAEMSVSPSAVPAPIPAANIPAPSLAPPPAANDTPPLSVGIDEGLPQPKVVENAPDLLTPKDLAPDATPKKEAKAPSQDGLADPLDLGAGVPGGAKTDKPDGQQVEVIDNNGKYLEDAKPVQNLAKQTEPKLPPPSSDSMGIKIQPLTAQPNPESDLAIANKALELGRYQSALELFNKMYKRNKSDQRVLMGRAVSLHKLGLSDEAIRAYDELLVRAPDNPEVLTNMLGLLRHEYPSVALQRLLDLRKRFPQNATIAAQTGLAHASIGNLQEGVQYLGIAAGLDPDNPKHPFNMAVIAEKMNKPAEAISFYERALQADALNDDPEKKLQRDVIYDRLAVLRDRL